ncbi:MAG TPA: AcvB/VirJ family lysyl-phosphatidylglycerol hydrolase [Candidatus Polarisedimenticolia bacterium]|nr:AcvB/VirJ family lysyl-phosphatidylglycerol hydrolase [Candidatus Polarisedimenticolia bacterium]
MKSAGLLLSLALAVSSAVAADSPKPAAPAIRPSTSTLRMRMKPQVTVSVYAPTMSRPDLLPVIFLVGDWGWRPLQELTAAALAAEGRLVVGIDSTEYFERRMEPNDWSLDLKQFRDFTNGKAGRPTTAPVLLLGYGWGGEVIPYMLNRGGAEGFAGALLIGPNAPSAFIYRVSLQMETVPSVPDESFDTGQELKRLPPAFPVAFVEGELDTGSQAATLETLVRGPHKRAVVPGGDRQFHEVRDIFFNRISQGLAWLETQSPASPVPGTPASGTPAPGTKAPGAPGGR